METHRDLAQANQHFQMLRFEALRDLGLLPGRLVIAGLKHAHEQLSPSEILSEKYDTFTEFLDSEEGEYQDVFDTNTAAGKRVFYLFAKKVERKHKIDLKAADEKGLVPMPHPNGHRLFLHPQDSGNLFLNGYVESSATNSN